MPSSVAVPTTGIASQRHLDWLFLTKPISAYVCPAISAPKEAWDACASSTKVGASRLRSQTKLVRFSVRAFPSTKDLDRVQMLWAGSTGNGRAVRAVGRKSSLRLRSTDRGLVISVSFWAARVLSRRIQLPFRRPAGARLRDRRRVYPGKIVEAASFRHQCRRRGTCNGRHRRAGS